jgi:hypothetical protein
VFINLSIKTCFEHYQKCHARHWGAAAKATAALKKQQKKEEFVPPPNITEIQGNKILKKSFFYCSFGLCLRFMAWYVCR